jgi:hypothetical protein
VSTDLTNLLDMDDEELHGELGAALMGEGTDFGVRDLAEFAAFARRWLRDRSPELRSGLCGRREIRAMRSLARADTAVEVATVADVLASWYGMPTAAIIAVILVRRGLNALCGDDDGAAEEENARS